MCRQTVTCKKDGRCGLPAEITFVQACAHRVPFLRRRPCWARGCCRVHREVGLTARAHSTCDRTR